MAASNHKLLSSANIWYRTQVENLLGLACVLLREDRHLGIYFLHWAGEEADRDSLSERTLLTWFNLATIANFSWKSKPCVCMCPLEIDKLYTFLLFYLLDSKHPFIYLFPFDNLVNSHVLVFSWALLHCGWCMTFSNIKRNADCKYRASRKSHWVGAVAWCEINFCIGCSVHSCLPLRNTIGKSREKVAGGLSSRS